MFNIKNGIISLNKTRRLSPKQINQLNRMSNEGDKNKYLLSVLGLRQPLYVDRLKVESTDRLASKRKNSIARLMENLKDLYRDHAPTIKDRGQWVGVEIECLIPHQDGSDSECCCEYDDGTDNDATYVCNSCNGEGNWSEDDAHDWLKGRLRNAGVTRVQVKSDGSVCDRKGHGVECTILFNSAYGFEPLHKLCKALHDAGCYVNKSCGLHVHLDARHVKAKRAYKIAQSIGHALPVIKYLVDESRHDNDYCLMQVSGMTGTRYCAVNLTAFRKYKTIEIRLHGGSINPNKIIHWIKLLKIIGASNLTAPFKCFQDLLDLDGVTDSMIEYMEKRINKLHPNAWPKLMPVEPESVPIVPLNVTAEEFDTITQRQGA